LFILGNLLNALAMILDVVLQGLFYIVLVNALLSWVRPDPSNPIVQFLDRVSDLLCDPVRRLFPTAFGGIDFAPFIVMLVLWFSRMFVVETLRDFAVRMG
jgi:YggT family protein